MKKRTFRNLAFSSLLLIIFSNSTQAQYLRSSYFMNENTSQFELNPALLPQHSYIGFPALGSLTSETSSNTFDAQNIIDLFDQDNEFYNKDQFYNKLKATNDLNANIRTNLISFGIRKRKGFWSFNIGARGDVETTLSKTMFDYLRAVDNENYDWKNSSIDIRNNKLRMNIYTEIGAGYSHIINNRLAIGGRVKLLLGMGNIDMNINRLYIYGKEDGRNSEYQLQTDANMKISAKGLKIEENKDGYIQDLDYDNFGISGYGAGVDFGLSYKLLDNITLSASLLDLGFISWSKANTQTAASNDDIVVNQDNYGDSPDLLDLDLYGLKKQENKSRKTSLSPTLVFAGGYDILQRKLGFGILSTTRMGKLKTYSELTLSMTYRPYYFFNTSINYSILKGGETFGVAFKIGSLMIGSDYLYLGKSTKHINAFIGMSIPLSKRHKESNPTIRKD